MEILTQTPVSLLLMLSACAHQRNGGKFAAPTYTERDTVKSFLNPEY